MLDFSAKIVADSQAGTYRITTLELCYPRFIHSEFMTHRVFSRNAMSSRAVPVHKMIEQVRTNPAAPVHWGANQAGMQAATELMGEARIAVKETWLEASLDACKHATRMTEAGAHKQIVNRLLEPFQWMRTIVTATDWDNFFSLRCHPDAQPEMQKLAYLIREVMAGHGTTVFHTAPCGWHLPYVTQEEYNQHPVVTLVKLSTARCARVSYLTHDGQHPDLDKDVALYERLVGSEPRHSSPSEHQAQADPAGMVKKLWGNFHGWAQHRKMIELKYGILEP